MADLYAEMKARAEAAEDDRAALLALAHQLERWLLADVEASHLIGEDMRVYHLDGGMLGTLLSDARAAIAKAERQA